MAEALPKVECGEPLTLLLLDMDHFKSIDDRFGHAVGDAVLRQMGALLAASCRASDLAVRYGGEEFVLALTSVDRAAAVEIADRLRSTVAAHDWPSIAPGLSAAVSIGVASASEAGDAGALLALTDRRLYAAKHGGRNQVVAVN